MTWPGTGIFCHDLDRFKTERTLRIPVDYPKRTTISNIYFGVGFRDPSPAIECYIDKDRLHTTGNSYETKLSSVNELGRTMSATITSSYIPQLQNSTIEVDLAGGSGILIEKTINLVLQDSSQVKNWDISVLDNIKQLFDNDK